MRTARARECARASPVPGPVVDVVPLTLENQKVGRLWLTVFAVRWTVAFLDGFDPRIISFAGRYVQRALALTNTELGTFGVLGTLVGGWSSPSWAGGWPNPALIISVVEFRDVHGAVRVHLGATRNWSYRASSPAFSSLAP